MIFFRVARCVNLLAVVCSIAALGLDSSFIVSFPGAFIIHPCFIAYSIVVREEDDTLSDQVTMATSNTDKQNSLLLIVFALIMLGNCWKDREVFAFALSSNRIGRDLIGSDFRYDYQFPNVTLLIDVSLIFRAVPLRF